MKVREAVQNMIRLLRELNATLSFIKWELMFSTKPFIGWLVALFLFLLFSIFTCFTLSYSSHTLNHPVVFPCSYLHAFASQSSWLSRASTSGSVSVSNAFQRARVSSPSPCCWKRRSPSREGLVFQLFMASCRQLQLNRRHVRSWLAKGVRRQRSGGHGHSQKGSLWCPRLLIVRVILFV